MRRHPTPSRSALAAALVACACLPAAANAAAPGPGLKVVSKNQKRVVERRKLIVRVGSPATQTLRLRARLQTRDGKLRRFVRPRSVSVTAGGSTRVRLRLTSAGLSRLDSARHGCLEAVAKLIAKPVGGRAAAGPGRKTRRGQLQPDPDFCGSATAGGGAGGGAGSGGGGGPAFSNLRAGAATADITAPIGTPMFAYTARSNLADPDPEALLLGDPDTNLYAKSFEPSNGIHTRPRSSAIVLEQDGQKFALVQADLGGIPYALIQEVQKKITATGISSDRLMISATHTHSSTGPIWPFDNNGYALLGGDLFDPRVFEITADGIAEAILGADANLEQAQLGVGSAELRGASNNREFETFLLNPEAPAVVGGDETAAREAALNRTLTVIRVDAVDGRPLGVWSNFAIHGTSFGDSNLLFSGDNMATTERTVEQAISDDADSHGLLPPGSPPVVDVWSNSSEGDVSPNGGPSNPDGEPLEYVPTSAAGANIAGQRVADGTLDAWQDAGSHMTGTPNLDTRRTFMIFDGTEADTKPVGPTEALGHGGITMDDGVCSPVEDVAGPGQGKKLPIISGLGLVPSSAAVSMWRINSLGIAGIPSEVTTQMGRRITSALAVEAGAGLDSNIIAGLTNGYLSYTATPEEYDGCTYEGSFTLFGRHQGPRYRDVASSLVAPLLGGTPAPPGLEPPEPALGTPTTPATMTTADAGTPTQQPAATLRRYDRATFKWEGGDASIDPVRGEPFVSLQHLEGGDWVTVGTDDGPADTTEADRANTNWTETWQFSNCDPTGSYRFHVTGHAVRSSGGAVEPYTLDSDQFDLGPTAPLEIIDSSVNGTTARVRARYPDPGAALLALPRRVRTGQATITVDEPGTGIRQVQADLDDDRLGFEAGVAAGSTIESVEVEDGCGNSTA